MILRLQLCNYRITLTFAKTTTVYGVNSLLPDGSHILMWDFDGTSIDTVLNELLSVQRTYKLPEIRIAETKPNTNFIAMCMKRCTWHKIKEIIAFTKGVDANFFKYGVYRGKFTLRVTPKSGRSIHYRTTLPSYVKSDVSLEELKSWVKYQTLPDGYRVRLYQAIINV